MNIALYENYGTNDQNMILAAMDGVQAMQEEEASDLAVSGTYRLGVQQSRVIHAQVQPVTAAQFEGLTFESSDPDIATVDEHGVITGVKKGSCEVTVTTESGLSKTVEVKVTRTEQDTGVEEDTKLPDKPVITPAVDGNNDGSQVDTGDATMLWIWVLLLLTGVAGMNGAAVYRKKKRL